MTIVNLTCSADNHIYANAPTTNYGTLTFLHARGSIATRPLLRFDPSPLPDQYTILSATLKLYCQAVNDVGSATFDAFRVYRNWSETQSTWNVYSTGNSWGTAGCNDTVNDRSGSSMGSKAVTVEAAWYNWTLAVADTKLMLDNNQGLILIQTAGGANFLKEFTSRTGTAGQRPILTIEYTLGSAQAVWFV